MGDINLLSIEDSMQSRLVPRNGLGGDPWRSARSRLLDKSIVFVSSVLHRLLGRAALLRSLRPGRLSENWDSGYGLGVRRLEGQLLREKSDAVASGFGVERVRRFIDLELLRLAHDLEVLLRQFAIQKRFVG